MNTQLFIRRPITTTLIMAAILIFGVFAYRLLPVSDLPNVDFPTIQVSATLPGASPDEISSSVIEPMEEAISGVSGIDEISARINEGGGTITVRFVLERNLNDAANDVSLRAEFAMADTIDLAAGEALVPPPGLRFLARPGTMLMGTHDTPRTHPFHS